MFMTNCLNVIFFSELGNEVALLLGLDNPEAYLTNCFNISRRARGTSPLPHANQTRSWSR